MAKTRLWGRVFAANKVVNYTFLVAWLCLFIIVIDRVASVEDEKSESPSGRERRLPGAIIIGVRKSGTRALLKFLELNPNIRAASREVHFFDKPSNYEKGLDWYKAQMPASLMHQITIEKSPAYFVTRNVPEKVQEMNATIKLVVVFRDPVTRLISDFSQLIDNKISHKTGHPTSDTESRDRRHVESIWDWADGKFEKFIMSPDGGIDERRMLIKTSMYSTYLEEWRKVFPSRAQFHYVDGERLIRNPYEELLKLEMFLGVKPSINKNQFIFNSKKGFFCMLINSTSADNLKNSTSNSNEKTPTTTHCLSGSKGRRHVRVKESLLNELRMFYQPYNEYLYSMTGINFNWTHK